MQTARRDKALYVVKSRGTQWKLDDLEELMTLQCRTYELQCSRSQIIGEKRLVWLSMRRHVGEQVVVGDGRV